MVYNLPKPYLSYSAISSWMKYPDQFRARYYENRHEPVTPELSFGKKIALLLENQHTDVAHIRQYAVPEQKIEIEIEGVKIFGFVDSFDPVRNAFLEFKTGKTPWTKKRVEDHLQLDIYSLAIETIFGAVQDDCHLIWMETERVDRPYGSGRITHEDAYGIRLTGRVETFERVIDADRRAWTRDLILRVAKEISDDYTAWQAKKTTATRGGRTPL
jgi:RecB family exonuclease